MNYESKRYIIFFKQKTHLDLSTLLNVNKKNIFLLKKAKDKEVLWEKGGKTSL